jgi:hypothetical protein
MVEGSRQRPGHTRRRLLIGLAAIALAGGTVGILARAQAGTVNGAAGHSGPVAAAEVLRQDLADTRRFNGTLGHGEPLTVVARGQGVVTRVADQGADLVRGAELMRVNERPVVALYGAIPMFRDLGPGAEGADVEQLIENLTALGYADCDATDGYTSCVEAAVRDWQEDVGATVTGQVSQADVIFVAEGSRIDLLHVRVGDLLAPGGRMVDVTGSDQVVRLDVQVRDRDLLAVDTEVTVQLPGRLEVTGTVTSSTVVAASMNDPGADDTVARIEVTLDAAADAALLGAPASVHVQIGVRPDVLTIPVNALLAMAGGGHAVEVIGADGTTELVRIETGLFAGGRVEITGDGINEGTLVGTARR